MDPLPTKRCLLCGQAVPANAVKCAACGKGRFEVEKRHAAERERRGSLPRAGQASGRDPGPPPAGTPAREEAAPDRGVLSRLRSWFRRDG